MPWVGPNVSSQRIEAGGPSPRPWRVLTLAGASGTGGLGTPGPRTPLEHLRAIGGYRSTRSADSSHAPPLGSGRRVQGKRSVVIHERFQPGAVPASSIPLANSSPGRIPPDAARVEGWTPTSLPPRATVAPLTGPTLSRLGRLADRRAEYLRPRIILAHSLVGTNATSTLGPAHRPPGSRARDEPAPLPNRIGSGSGRAPAEAKRSISGEIRPGCDGVTWPRQLIFPPASAGP